MTIRHHHTLKHAKTFILGLTLSLSTISYAQTSCTAFFNRTSISSYNEILDQMKKDPYPVYKLPIQPITLFRTIAKHMLPEFFVGKRSVEILQDKRDYREVGLPKPIHPMGVGFEGVLQMKKSRWSGSFRGGTFPVLVRASISQGNPFKNQTSGKAQPRSTAFAIKIFKDSDLTAPQKTANIVFQNDLNGQVNSDGSAIDWTQADQTNQPPLNILKIRHFYEVMTLLGVAKAAIKTKSDHTTRFPYVNPVLRPVHSMAELGETDPNQVQTPVWLMLRPSKEMIVVREDDFRNELTETAKKNGQLIYDLYAADSLDSSGQKEWESVGQLVLKSALLSRGVDQNVLFPHDTIRSSFTGKEIQTPSVPKKEILLPTNNP